MTRAKLTNLLLVLSFALSTLLYAERAHAHPYGTSFRLGLGLPALTTTYFPSPVPDELIITWGLYPITFGVQLGVQVSHEIGLAVLLYGGGYYNDALAPDLRHYIYFAAVPRFEYLFWPHGTVAPYLGIEIGGEVQGYPSMNLQDLFRTGGFFGLHIFPIDEFSIDLELAANFLYDFDRDIAGFRAVFYLAIMGWLH
jgi:hypothetical protein